ncbi:polyribonucleotide nucleotidyltransferase [Telmatocola sphagniphila]|uniref:Polyribonucleotide nucleotidyltransferase n=1 Tax=Telmatocola sphagniphila TaxID=1123043 RepID=A0A8E6ET84_9BACT|nr:polyribonucleotide nucleotidyltransferase [Telmatocola sphagniphila]QVL32119.1 polyribonucleotide nucleotidyltransferase [Telmatocola sphagniphila]
MTVTRVECALGAGTLILETGKLAKQAHGSVVVRYGDTMTLVAAVAGKLDPTRDFFPLTVDYREKPQAAGKFPGGYIKREGRPTTKEILTARLIDRPIRPLFPADYFNEVQVMCQVISADRENDPDILSMIGASAALYASPIPFQKPTGAVRVGRVNGEFVVMPSHHQMEESDLDLIVSGTKEAVAMIEGFSRELSEEVMGDAVMFGHKYIVQICELIEELREKAGMGTKPAVAASPANPLIKEMYDKFAKELRARKLTVAKLERYEKVAALKDEMKKHYFPEGATTPPEYSPGQFAQAWALLEEKVFRDIVLDGGRIDGRGFKQIRALHCEVSLLPRTHGSALFTRGETQALVTATLGTAADEQRIEGLEGEYVKKFMLDYNFPPFSVGECKPLRGPGRREIGHGMLAERSLKAVMPLPGKFPYTVRLVSDILESNGSSSMASVCGGTLALMDAGVPIQNPVAGISIGLVKEADKFILFTDIQGDEDHYGDMDFKVAGTQRGITGIQLDLKLEGIGEEIIRAALTQAKDARIEILRTMLVALRKPRGEISAYAPRLLQIKINPEKIGLLIGPGGKNIKGIQEATGAKIDIDDDGTVSIAHSDAAGAQAAKARVEALTGEVEIGKVYEGKVISVKDFGAFVEIMPGRDGLVHISELDHAYVGRVDDVLRVGDPVKVICIDIDNQDRVKLSRKALLPAPPPGEGGEAPPPEGGRPPREDRGERNDRGGGGGGRGGDRGDRGGRGGDRRR